MNHFQKILSLTMLMLFSCAIILAQTVAEQPSNYGQTNAGTALNPYLISNLANLKWLSEETSDWWVNSTTPVHFQQTADIDATETASWSDGFTSTGFIPINHYTGPLLVGTDDFEFIGTYDGENYEISNLSIYRDNVSISRAGLFGKVSGTSNFLNINLKNVQITANAHFVSGIKTEAYAGGIVAMATGSVNINNCSVSGSIVATNDDWLGLPIATAGGLIGATTSSLDINFSSYKGDINTYGAGDTSAAGGLLGLSTGSMTDIGTSFSTGFVTGISQSGGIIGMSTGTIFIENTYYQGYIACQGSGITSSGGIIGVATQGYIKDSYFSGNSSAVYYGALVGTSEDPFLALSNCVYNADTPQVLDPVGSGTADITDTEAYSSYMMKLSSTYLAKNWNMTSIWNIDRDYNYGYPYLGDFLKQELTPAPQNLTYTLDPSPQGGNFVTLSWDPPISAPRLYLVGYLVYRDQELETEEALTTAENEWTDQDPIAPNISHTYGVIALYSDCESGPILKTVNILPEGAERPSNYETLDAGRENNPYLIANLANLKWMSEVPEEWASDNPNMPHYFLQTADIDAADTMYWSSGYFTQFRPIGYIDEYNNYFFCGVYDGQSFSISNLYIETSSYYNNPEEGRGLFATILGTDSVIKNLRLENIHYLGGGMNVGGIAGRIVGSTVNSTKIQNCSVSGYIYGGQDSDRVNYGGLVGFISNASPASAVIIENCYSTVNLEHYYDPIDSENYLGGIVGNVSDNTIIRNSYFAGRIAANSYTVGGIAGYVKNETSILNSYSTGILGIGSGPKGGLVGSLADATTTVAITSSFWDWQKSGVQDLAGVTNNLANITNSFERTYAEMRVQSNFTDFGWNFATIWALNAERNDGYPYLQVLPQPLLRAPRNIVHTLDFDEETGVYSIILSWNAPLTDSDGTFVGYQIYRNAASMITQGAYTSTTWTDPGNYFTDSGIPYAISTYYLDAAGKTLESIRVNYFVLIPAYNPPQNVQATPGDQYIDLTWEAPEQQNYGTVIGYAISNDTDQTLVSNSISATTFSYRITGLTNNVRYTLRVYARYDDFMEPGFFVNSAGTYAYATPNDGLPEGAERPANFTAADAGTETNPYLIANLANLKWMSEMPQEWWIDDTSIHFLQTANIDAADTYNWSNQEFNGFRPIGYAYSEVLDPTFRGVYDGQNYTISGLTIDTSNEFIFENFGLFSVLTSSTIRNLRLENIHYLGSGKNVGGIAGKISHTTTIENCSVTGLIRKYEDAGLAQVALGGLVGVADTSGLSPDTINNSYSTVTLMNTTDTSNIGNNKLIGGIVGYMSNGAIILNTYFAGEIITNVASIGGLVGGLEASGIISTSYSSGVLDGGTPGGLVGQILFPTSATRITSCFWDAEKSGVTSLFGITTTADLSFITNSLGWSTAEMKVQSNFTDFGWSFVTIWGMDPDGNDGYPYLRSFPPQILRPPTDFTIQTMGTAGNYTFLLNWMAPDAGSTGTFLHYKLVLATQNIETTAHYYETSVVYPDNRYLYYLSTVYEQGESRKLVLEGLIPLYNPPRNLEVVNVGDGIVELVWDAPIPQNFGTVESYNILRDSEIIGVTTTTSYSDEELPNAVTYTYAVSANYTYTNSSYNWYSGPSNSVTARPEDNIVPPSNVTAVRNGDNIVISWEHGSRSAGANFGRLNDAGANSGRLNNALLDDNGSRAFQSYILFRNTTMIANNLTELTFTDLAPEKDTAYTYYVGAKYASSNSEMIASNMIYLPVYNPPTNFTGKAGNGFIDLSWSAPEPQNFGTLVLYSLFKDNNVLITFPLPSTFSYTDTEVVNGTEYQYNLITMYSFTEFPLYNLGMSDQELCVTTVTPDASLPLRPANYYTPNAGTEANPYHIANLANLRWLSEVPEDWYNSDFPGTFFLQTADIDAADTINWNAGQGFRPIGFYEVSGSIVSQIFYGYYDGGSYRISNLYMNRSVNETEDCPHFGLFGSLADSTILKNIKLENIDYTIHDNYNMSYIGGLYGFAINSGLNIFNCYTTGNITTSGNGTVGGLAGRGLGIMRTSYSAVNLNTTGYTINAGGLVGSNNSTSPNAGLIENCYFLGQITASTTGNTSVGGIVGSLNGSYEISKCYSAGTLTGNYVGGFIGFNSSTYLVQIKDSVYDGWRVTSGLAVGFGQLDTSINNSGAYATIQLVNEEMNIFVEEKLWDFDTIWTRDITKNQGYPHLLFSQPPTLRPVNNLTYTNIPGQLMWSAPTTGSYGTILGYNVYLADQFIDFTTSTIYTADGIFTHDYLFYVSAVYDTGASAPKFTYAPYASINPPQALTASIENDYILLTWQGPLPQESGTLTGYRINKDGDYIATTTNFYYWDSDLESGEQYGYQVEALYEYNHYGMTFSWHTLPSDPALISYDYPIPPYNVVATLDWVSNNIVLTWEHELSSAGASSAGANPGRPNDTPNNENTSRSLQAFNIYRNGYILAENITAYTYTDEAPAKDTGFMYQVTAVYTDVESGPEDAIPDPIYVPIANPPQNFTATAGNGIVYLSWEAPEPQNFGVINGYAIRRNGTLILSSAAQFLGTTFEDTSVTNGTEYLYELYAAYLFPEYPAYAANGYADPPLPPVTPDGSLPLRPANYNTPDAGTATNPYLIANLYNLRWLSEVPEEWYDGATLPYFLQTADIDAADTENWNNGTGFRPIGYDDVGQSNLLMNHIFTGVYNGSGHIISNLYLNTSVGAENTLSFGLFSAVTPSSTLFSIGLENINYTITHSGFSDVNIGGVMGYAKGSINIYNCYTTGSININSPVNVVGGIAGRFLGNFVHSYSTVQINTSGNTTIAGGLIGSDSSNFGPVSSNLQYCYFLGTITSQSAYGNVGGFIGTTYQGTTYTIYDCYSAGILAGNDVIGGIIGQANTNINQITISNTVWDIWKAGTEDAVGRTSAVDSVDLINTEGWETTKMSHWILDPYTSLGWDFTNVWTKNQYQNQGYPYLLGHVLPTLNPPIPMSVSLAYQESTELRWYPHNSGGNEGIHQGYAIYKEGVKIAELPSTQNTFTDPDVEPFQYYVYGIAAINDVGESSQTYCIAMTGLAPAPQNFTATPQNEQVLLSWEPSPSNPYPSSIQGSYSILREGNGQIASVGTLTYTDTGLTNGTAYTYRVLTSFAIYKYEIGAGYYSAETEPITVTPFEQIIPPSEVTAGLEGTNDVQINWTHVPVDYSAVGANSVGANSVGANSVRPNIVGANSVRPNNEGTVRDMIGFLVYRNGTQITPDPIDAYVYFDQNVPTDLIYEYGVQAVYTAGESEIIMAESLLVPRYTPPTDLTGEGHADEIRLAWTAPAPQTFGVLDHYVVQKYSPLSGTVDLIVPATSTTLIDTDIVSKRVYDYQVFAYYTGLLPDVNLSEPTNTVSAAGYQIIKPHDLEIKIVDRTDPITLVTKKTPMITWLHDDWDDLIFPVASSDRIQKPSPDLVKASDLAIRTNENPNPRTTRDLRGFYIYRNTSKLNETPVVALEYFDDDCPDDQTYVYSVTAIYGDGESEEESNEGGEVLVPRYSIPQNFTVQVTDYTVHSAWETPAEQTYGTLTKYILSRTDQNGNINSWNLPSSTMTYNDETTEIHMIYVYSIVAYYEFEEVELNDASESLESEEIWFGAEDMQSPYGIELEQVQGQARLTWHHPDETYLLGYDIYYYEDEEVPLKINDNYIVSIYPNPPQYTLAIPTDDGTYRYGVTAVYRTFRSPEPCYITIIIDGGSVIIGDSTDPLRATMLHGNYPNPFNPSTTIHFSLATASNVTLDIYNIRGQKVKSLVNGFLSSGEHSILWNGTDDSNRLVSSGLYLYQMRVGEHNFINRMTLMK